MKKKCLIDLHIHSHFSDGKLSIAEIVDLYGKKGFSAIAITDHLADSHSLTGFFTHQLNLSLSESRMPEYLDTLAKEAQRAHRLYNMLLIPGVEITLNAWSKNRGAHFVLLGVDRYIDPDQSVVDILGQNRHLFSIAAHPIWDETYEFKTQYLWNNRHSLSPYFDAWECATASKFSKEVYLSGFAVVASSDFHRPSKFESWKTQTYLEDLNRENLYHQIRSRQVEPVWI